MLGRLCGQPSFGSCYSPGDLLRAHPALVVGGFALGPDRTVDASDDRRDDEIDGILELRAFGEFENLGEALADARQRIHVRVLHVLLDPAEERRVDAKALNLGPDAATVRVRDTRIALD